MRKEHKHKNRVLETQAEIRAIKAKKGDELLLTTLLPDVEVRVIFEERMESGTGIVVHFEGGYEKLLWTQIRKIRY